jgi:hypothetical protein
MFKNMSNPTITFGANANQEVVSDHTRTVLTGILNAAGLSSCRITSTSRTPADQARVMFNNIVEHGVAAQKALYSSAGDAVIDAYVLARNQGKSSSQIKEAMKNKILQIGPSRVSRHCADPAVLNVVDISPGSITNKTAFEAAVNHAVQNGSVSKFLEPPSDPAYHLEIPQS